MNGPVQPLVSVVIAAHDSAATIERTISSVTGGTYRNIEVIVVDDGSTDRTSAIVAHMADRDSRIRLLSREWSGVSAAYSAGVAQSQGEYIAFLDSDDLWHPTKLEKQVALASCDPELGFIYTFVRMIDAEDRVIHDVPDQRFPRRALCRGLYESLVGANSSALIRRSALRQAGQAHGELQAKQDLMLQLDIFANSPIGFVPEYLVAYRSSRNSLSGDPMAMLVSWRAVRDRARALLPKGAARVRRWADARQYSELAESFARRGSYGIAVRLLLAALLRDPVRLALYLLYRFERTVTRAQSRTDALGRGPTFARCSPDQLVRPKDAKLGPAHALLDALDARRIRFLAHLDGNAA